MTVKQKQLIQFNLMLTILAISTYAQKSYNFKDPKGVNSMSFQLYSDIEPISGTASDISGEITFNPDKPQDTRGKIIVAAAGIHTTNKRMTQVLHGEDWIDVEKYPTAEYKITGISEVKKKSDIRYSLVTKGEFTLKGKTKKMAVPIKLSYQKAKLNARNHKGTGDLIILQTNFSIDRKAFKIKPDMDNTVVAEKIDITFGIVGASPDK